MLRMTKSALSGGLALILAVVAAAPAFASGSVTGTVYGKKATETYSDIKANTPAAQAIGLVTEAGLITGEPDGTFSPDKPATNSVFAEAIVKYLGLGSSVSAGSGGQGYVNEAESLGLLPSGTSTTGSMNRLDVALAFAKALKLTPVTGTLPWSDASSIPTADQGLLLALYQKGYFKGFSNNTFGGSATLTREQIALIFGRLLGL